MPWRVQVSLTQQPVCRPRPAFVEGRGPPLGKFRQALLSKLVLIPLWPQHAFEALTQVQLGSAHCPGADLSVFWWPAWLVDRFI